MMVGVPDHMSAQSIWTDRGSRDLVAVEFLKPNFEGDSPTTFMTSALFLTGRFSLKDNLALIGEFPFSHYGYEDRDVSETGFGNPYIGLEFWGEGSHAFYELGIRIPTASEEKGSSAIVGFLSDYDRFEAFVPEMLSIPFKANYGWKDPVNNFVYRIRGGPVITIPTDGGDTEAYLDYGFLLGWEDEQFGLTGGFTGRAFISEDDLSLGERTIHQVGFQAKLILDHVCPGVHLQIPLDEDFLDILDLIVGLHVSFRFD
jgi:hypothetical protein